MKDLPLELKGLIFSYLDDREILDYMKSSDKCYTEIKKFSKYITLKILRVIEMDNILYFTDMKIEELFLYMTHITDQELKIIIKCIKRIKCVWLSNCFQISDAGLEHLQNMKMITIHNCDKITDSGLVHLQNMNKIHIYGNNNITHTGLKYLSNIFDVDISSCNNINDEGLEYLENVHTLSLNYLKNITDKGIKKLKNVKYLEMTQIYNITNDCFKYLGNLEVLEINFNRLLTDSALIYLSNINFLKFVGCENITIEGIEKLLEKRPELIWKIDGVGNNGSDEMNFFDKS
jgi:F-box/leucine-rich repeat protein 14